MRPFLAGQRHKSLSIENAVGQAGHVITSPESMSMARQDETKEAAAGGDGRMRKRRRRRGLIGHGLVTKRTPGGGDQEVLFCVRSFGVDHCG